METQKFEPKAIKAVRSSECKGLFFRGYNSTYFNGSKIEYKEGIRLLKRKSCSGCSECGFFLDDMGDMIDCDGLIFPKEGILNGKLYTLVIANVSRDYESGLVDDWNYKIVEVEEDNELCPECGCPLKTKASGVKCTKCTYWFCF